MLNDDRLSMPEHKTQVLHDISVEHLKLVEEKNRKNTSPEKRAELQKKINEITWLQDQLIYGGGV